MASFINYEATPNAENYSNRSRGVDAPQANKALGTLFEGIGSVVDSTVKLVDNNNIRNINNELQTGIDAIRGAQGVDAAINDPTVTGGEQGNNAPGGGTPPPGVSTATSEIARINQAYKEGKIGDTYYYAKVESLARQIRAKYPGYREEIDKKVSSIIGTNPANALRSSIISDLKASESTARSRANSDESIVEKGKEYLSPEKYNRWIRGDRSPEFTADLKMDIQRGEVKKQDISSQKAQYELRKEQNAATKGDLEKIVTRDSSDLVWKIINDGIDAGGSTLNISSLNQKLGEMAKSGKPPTAEELGTIRAGINALTTQANLALDRQHSAPWGKDGKYTYQQEINDPQALNRIKEQALAPIRNMEKALTDGNVGMFSWYANQAKLMKDQTMQNILTRSETARSLQAAQEILGPAMGQLLIENGMFAKAASDLARVLNMDSVAKSATGTSNGSNILRDTIRESKAAGGVNGAKESVQSVVTTTKNTLASKNISDQALANFATTWFNPNQNFLNDRDLLTENSRQSVIQTFSAPEVVDNMSRLKNSNPQVWNNYKSWVESSTRSVFNSAIGTLNEWAKPGSGYNVVVDNQGRITVSRDRTMPTDAFTAQIDRSVSAMQKTVGQLNSAIDARRRIGGAEGGNPVETGAAFASALGLPMTAAAGGKPTGTSNPPSGGGNAPEELTVDPANFNPDEQALLIELERGAGEPVDLEARDVRRARGGFQSDPNWATSGASIPNAADLRTGIRAAADELGIDPVDLATVISYETGGRFDPAIRGGAGNRHIGLIQFGPEEQRMYGANQQQTTGEQLQAVVRYLKHRGFTKGMGILDLYSTINAGSPGRYGASDANNGGAPGTVRDKVNNQMAGHRRKAMALLAQQD